jgi:hypothetical protein
MFDQASLVAIVYDDGDVVRDISENLAADWRRSDLRVCGLIETHIPRPGRRRCDMLVTELASGERIAISQDRGALARGCTLDDGALIRAGGLVRRALENGAERMIMNKFGKAECEGRGLRSVIADAIERGVASVVFVPRRNLDAWRAFAGELAVEREAAEFTALDAVAA